MDVVPTYVRRVLVSIEDSGFEAVLVGGCVRDMLLGRAVHDWDVATAAPAAHIAALFPKTVETGARFGTVTVVTGEGNVEVTTYRTDGAYTDSRRPDSVAFVGELTEDLKRRDFTMNAMAIRPDGAVVDPFGGSEDIERRLIRCVGIAEDRFSEDALRLFRALRFAAQLSFDIEAGTAGAIRKCAPLCAALSAERVRDETEKILLSGRPELVGTAIDDGLYTGRINEAEAVPEDFRRIGGLEPDREQRWSAFCAVLLQAGLIASASGFLAGMRLDTKTIRSAGDGAASAVKGDVPSDAAEGTPAVKRLLSALGADGALCAAASSDVLFGGDAVRRVRAVLDSGECWSVRDLAMTGSDLVERGFKPGPQLGRTLKRLLEHVIENPEDNNKEALVAYVRQAGWGV